MYFRKRQDHLAAAGQHKFGYKTTVLPLDYRNEQDYRTDYRLLVMGNSYVVAKNFSAHKVKG
jgi:hypothetical protein